MRHQAPRYGNNVRQEVGMGARVVRDPSFLEEIDCRHFKYQGLAFAEHTRWHEYVNFGRLIIEIGNTCTLIVSPTLAP